VWPFKAEPRGDLEQRVERLERAVRDLSADWDMTYEKFAMLLKRFQKRAKAEAESPNTEQPVRNLVSRIRGE